MMVTEHAMRKATEIQKEFEHRYAHASGVIGVGIGLNESEDELAINVQVSREAARQNLPSRFDGMDVVVDVVGKVSAY